MKPNPFLTQIQAGKIQTLEQLKKAFRKIALTLHPDTTKDKRSEKSFIKMTEHYQEAIHHLESGLGSSHPKSTPPDFSNPHRRSQSEKAEHSKYWKERFFKQWLLLDMIMDPDFLFPDKREELSTDAQREMFFSFSQWAPEKLPLFKRAWKEYGDIEEAPLAKDLGRVFYHLAKFTLTEDEKYKDALESQWEQLIQRIKALGMEGLVDLLTMFIEDRTVT